MAAAIKLESCCRFIISKAPYFEPYAKLEKDDTLVVLKLLPETATVTFAGE